jgi:uncharacterized membrane protein YkvA (DUF1232 family)
MRPIERLRGWARALKRDVIALWIVARLPETPIAAKLVAGAVAAYALSPIDLIPDFVPVLGYLDDLILVPVGIMLALRLVPPPLLVAAREAAVRLAARPVSRIAAAAVIACWLALAVAGWAYWR